MGPLLTKQHEGRSSTSFHQAIAALPSILEPSPYTLTFGLSHFAAPGPIKGGRVGEASRFQLGQLKQLAVADQVGYAEVGQSRLAGAEELARAALRQVQLRQLESVLGADHGVESLFTER